MKVRSTMVGVALSAVALVSLAADSGPTYVANVEIRNATTQEVLFAPTIGFGSSQPAKVTGTAAGGEKISVHLQVDAPGPAATAATGAPATDVRDSESPGAEAVLLQRSRDWATAAAGGDVEAILAYWSDDAMVMPPGRPPLEGKAAIREYVAESLKVPGFAITWEPLTATVAASGDLGYLVERNRVTVPGEAGELLTISGQGITVWQRRDGQWLCVLDIWNELPPPAPAP